MAFTSNFMAKVKLKYDKRVNDKIEFEISRTKRTFERREINLKMIP